MNRAVTGIRTRIPSVAGSDSDS